MNFDLVIVGAGIAGASLAWRMAAHGRVLLLEAEAQPGMHSTGRSAAMFMESYGPPQVRALTRVGRAFYSQPAPGFADNALLSPRGAMYAAWQGQQADLEQLHAELAATGCRIERLSPAEVLQRLPILRAEGLIGAVFEPDAMDIDVHALHQGYLRGTRQRGGALWLDCALHAAQREGRPGDPNATWRVHCSDGRIVQARRLVNAAGAWVDEVARRAGGRALGMQPKRRSAFTFDPTGQGEHRSWPTVCSVDESWYIKPDAGQLIGSPANADPVAPHDVVPEELDIATGIAHIERDTTLTIRRPRRTWAGLRTFSSDGELVIGFDADGLFWLAGQGGYGIQSAAGAALLAECLLRGVALAPELQAQQVDAAALSPTRFAMR